ncbi:MAG: AMP-binding protein [Actinobacteria bacterium]|nr:AMP-binding protein [Actinomycetota bacterium]
MLVCHTRTIATHGCGRLAHVGANLADLVQIAANERPDAPAIITSDRTTTWSELERLVRAVSGGLSFRRLDRGDRVAMVLGNSPEFVSTYFGILRAGLTAVPLNNSYTAPEIATVLRSSGAKLVITDRAAAATVRKAAGSDVAVIEVGSDDWRRLTVGSTPPPDFETDPESIAVLIYTAGTSGTPKGAMLSHRALGANLDQLMSIADPVPMATDDVSLIVLPMFHIYALNAALGLVAKTGSTAVLAERFDASGALRLIRDHHVTNIAGAPPMYIAWSAMPDLADRLATVRMLTSGAAPLPPAVHQQFKTAGLTIWEGYGMTEASPVISAALVSGNSKPGSVGKPLPGVEVKLVDGTGEEVDEGDPGEIQVRGANLFSGYWPDGAEGPDGDGWFATGDVALADEDGDLHLVDRRRDLILVSGFNVYPREIETVLSRVPGVAEVAVVGVSHPFTGEAVKAIVVPMPGIELEADDILEYAQGHLARFKSPTIVEVVGALPHSVTGKIIKNSLRDPAIDPRSISDITEAIGKSGEESAEPTPDAHALPDGETSGGKDDSATPRPSDD